MPIADDCSTRSGASVAARERWLLTQAPLLGRRNGDAPARVIRQEHPELHGMLLAVDHKTAEHRRLGPAASRNSPHFAA